MISIYTMSVTVFVRGLASLSVILRKTAAHAAARKIDDAVMLSTRLYPDMYPLVQQVQRATQVAAGCASRLVGSERSREPDTESTFTELIARIERSVAHLESLRPEQFTGSETGLIRLTDGPRAYEFAGLDYLLKLAIPNFYFHLVTAYDICRHSGVELGKQDFIGTV